MRELELVERIRRLVPASRGRRLVTGIGDDCAILRQPGSGEDLLLSTDLLVEDVHFRRATHKPADLGHKVLARGLSDIAAMGGKPRYVLISLALPGGTRAPWVDSFYRSLNLLAGRFGALVIGGDLARAEKLVCDIVVCGSVSRGTAMRRDRAHAGDSIYVSGELGGSALGLETGHGPSWRRHLRPEPRIELGIYLRARAGVRAAMDLSDGLSIDLHRMARESGLAARIEEPLPVFPGATLQHALHGGEDYELLFALPPGRKAATRHRGIPVTRIGSFEKGRPGALTCFGWDLEPRGYDHFR